LNCIHCNSEKVLKKGIRGNKQQYRCKNCNHWFSITINDEIEKVEGAEEEIRNKITEIYNGVYSVSYGNKRHGHKEVVITERTLRILRKEYTSSNITMDELALKYHFSREEFFAIKTAFNFNHKSIPFTDNELETIDEDILAQRWITEKKHSIWEKTKKLEEIQNKTELNQYRKTEYFYTKLLDAFKDISIVQTKYKTAELYQHRDSCNKIMYLPIADVHSGLKTNSNWNVYNLDVMKERFKKITKKVISEQILNPVKKIILNDLGDTVHGLIHGSVEAQSEDIISSFKEVMQCYIQLLTDLSPYFEEIEISKANGSHESLTKQKDDRTDEKNLGNLFLWTIELAFNNSNISNVKCNYPVDGFILNDLFNFCIIGIHGDETSFAKLINVDRMFKNKLVKEVHSGHRHHAMLSEEFGISVRCNPPVGGTDQYAKGKILNAEYRCDIYWYDEDGYCTIKPIRFK